MSKQTLRDIENKLLDATDFGLDIILEIYPQANPNKMFRIREEDKSASTSIKLIDNAGVRSWRLTDWGGKISGENCFGLWALDQNMSYTEAVLDLANIYQAKGKQILETEKVVYQAEYRECKPAEFEGDLGEKGFCYTAKEFNDFELGLLGPEIKGMAGENTNGNFRTPLITKEICDEVNLISLEEYSFLNKDKTKVCTFRSTENFPILAFINTDEKIGEWVKIYKPRGGKKYNDDGKDFRFQHLGGRPKGFIFGLDRLQDLLNAHRENHRTEYEIKHGANAETELENLKLDRICIATGGSDGLNLLAVGEPVVWFNSETEKLNNYTMNTLKKYADVIVNIPDSDSTGKREGRDLALEFMDIRTLWLDKYFKRSSSKDFKDFCKENQSLTKKQLIKRVGEMLDTSMPAKFWTSTYNEKSKRYSHSFSPTFAFYFLRLNGYCKVVDESRKDGYYFAKITGNVVEEVDVVKIKNYFKEFLTAKQNKEGVREVSHSLMDSLITTKVLADNTMAMLHDRELDFTDYEKDAQYFFLGDKVYKTSKHGTELSTFNRFVLKSQLIDELILEANEKTIDAKKFEIAKAPFFNIKEVGYKQYDVEILEKDCDFLNYFIQTSRVHWQTEQKAFVKYGGKADKFHEETKFQLTSKFLTEEENADHIQHFVSKIYIWGYMLHRYNDATRPWGPFAVDDAVMEDDVAEGGAGKSIFFQSLKYFCNFFEISKSEDKEDRFKFEGITKHTDIVYMDDVERNFDMKLFFSEMSGGMTVNTKNVSKIKIKASNTPKFAFSTNYAIRHNEGSYTRRRLLLGFSNYYHAENKETGLDSREPIHDFGHRMFDDWPDPQWFKYINFGFFCLQFYLSTNHKIEAPTNNIQMRTYNSEMGVHFKEWADLELVDLVGQKLVKETYLESCKNHNQKYLGNTTSANFKKKMRAWCKVNEYEFEDRIMENIMQVDKYNNILKDAEGKTIYKTTEHIKFFRKPDAEFTETRTEDSIANIEDVYGKD